MGVGPAACLDPKSTLYETKECQKIRTPKPQEQFDIIFRLCPPGFGPRKGNSSRRGQPKQPHWRFSPEQLERLLRELRKNEKNYPRTFSERPKRLHGQDV